jgi:hypothetical protein
MKLSLITKKTRPFYPRNHKCPVCSKYVGEPDSFLCFSGGAMKQIQKNVYSMDDDLFGFLDINFHGAHDFGRGKYREQFLMKHIVDHSACGQFDLYFCSTSCFRKFMNMLIDDLENELSGKKGENNSVTRSTKNNK